MSRFHFHLRARGTIHLDEEGIELPDRAAARAHAAAVAEELMRNAPAGTRHWSLAVEARSGHGADADEEENVGRWFEVFFADVDPRLAAYSPEMQLLVRQTSRRLGALTDVLAAAQAALLESRVLLARARGRPQLACARRG